MNATYIFKFLCEEIHTTVVATNDENGFPVTCAVDIMDYDENGLYFLTAKGKKFYNRLKTTGYLSLTGIKGKDTMSCVAVSVCGKIKQDDDKRLQRLLDKNPYMYEIYPTEQSRSALTAFCLYEGNGEWFDLSKKPIERFSFSFGRMFGGKSGYFITDKCVSCGNCVSGCPQNCIIAGKPYFIEQKNCLRCGNCYENCPAGAIEKS